MLLLLRHVLSRNGPLKSEWNHQNHKMQDCCASDCMREVNLCIIAVNYIAVTV